MWPNPQKISDLVTFTGETVFKTSFFWAVKDLWAIARKLAAFPYED